MSDIASTETIDTTAGTYTVTWHYDTDAESPLRDDDAMMAYLSGGRGVVYEDTLTGAAGATLATLIAHHGTDDVDAITRRYDKWRAITGSPWQLVTGSGTGAMQSHWWNWFVLVDVNPDTGYTDGAKAANGVMDDYERWASGDVYGFVVEGPNGEHVESVWGFIGDDGRRYAMDDYVRPAIDYDVAERTKSANLAGAGFVGII